MLPLPYAGFSSTTLRWRYAELPRLLFSRQFRLLILPPGYAIRLPPAADAADAAPPMPLASPPPAAVLRLPPA